MDKNKKHTGKKTKIPKDKNFDNINNILNDSDVEKGDILFYETEDGISKIDVKLIDETVWLSQADMCKLFDTSRTNIVGHISNVYEEKELNKVATCRDFRQVRLEGTREVNREIPYYNLDVIISVGYRVKSLKGTQFRIWATERLREYIIKGFTMNDDMLKKGGYNNYFEGLLARIRDIRSSEKVFYQKVLDIFSTSLDYNKNSDICKKFFKVIQNRFHYAVHKHTASEIIYGRVDAKKENLGLTNFKGKNITKEEAHTAKNYLSYEELDRLNRLVTIYLEFAEFQAINKVATNMENHIKKLDEILKMTGVEVLEHFGKISHKQAIDKADTEYEKYKKKQKYLSRAERDLINVLEREAKKLEK